MSIKLIATDLDGTLLKSDHFNISERNVNALKAAAEKGITLVIASGRAWCVIDKIVSDLGIIDYVISSNGASVIDVSNGSKIINVGINYDTWTKLYDLLFSYNCVFEIYCDGSSYIDSSIFHFYNNPNLPDYFIQKLKAGITPLDNVKADLYNQFIEKINVMYTPEDKIDELKECLRKMDDILISSSLPGNIEINRKDVNKGKMLEMLCGGLNITSDQVMTLGDNNNDLEMLRWAKWSFAMENATDEAKSAAHNFTASNEDDGVALAIEKYVLND